jgi:hypothetical protein
MHIPPELILPQDMIDVTDLGPPSPGEPPNGDADNLNWRARKKERDDFAAAGSLPAVIRMHISDAKHAMDVDPKRYVLAALIPPPKPEPAPEEPEPAEPEQTGADGPAWYPPAEEPPASEEKPVE